MTQRESVKLRTIDEKLDKHILSQLKITGEMNETLKSLNRAMRGEPENAAPGVIGLLGDMRADVILLGNRLSEVERVNKHQDTLIEAKKGFVLVGRTKRERAWNTFKDIWSIVSIGLTIWLVLTKAISWDALLGSH